MCDHLARQHVGQHQPHRPRQRVPFPPRQLLVGRLLRRRRRHRRRSGAGRRARIHGPARSGAGDVRAAARLRQRGAVGRRQRDDPAQGRPAGDVPGLAAASGAALHAARPSASPSPSISACERPQAISALSAAAPGAPRSPVSRGAPVARSRCGRAIPRSRARSRASAPIRSICPALRSKPASPLRRIWTRSAACDALLLVCPAQAVRDARPAKLPGDWPVVICAKGIEAHERPADAEVLEQVQPRPPARAAVGAELRGGGGARTADRDQHRDRSIRTSAAILRRRSRRARSGRTGRTTCSVWRWAAR